MYNLFVSANDEAWDGTPTVLNLARCLKSNEGTSVALVDEYGGFSAESIAKLKQFPAIFACETSCKVNARLGRLLSIKQRGGEVRVEYEFHEAYPPIPNEALDRQAWELGLSRAELWRTHWALKDEDLGKALVDEGFPEFISSSQPLVDIHEHEFDVSLSFPGENREYVEAVARRLVQSLGSNRVFYDNFFKAQLALPNLDTALQDLYRKRSRLIVAFLSEHYACKKWCGIEFKAIREILNSREDKRVMYIRNSPGEVEGVFSHDGYIDATTHSPEEVADMIYERVQLLRTVTA